VKTVHLHEEAEAELAGAVAFYEGRREGLGGEFRQEVEGAVGRIGRMPQAFTLTPEDGTRRCVLRRFPYTLHFLETEEAIWVLAVAHQRRKPGYWHGRTPPGP
jgi:toxin ParE1/3/4